MIPTWIHNPEKTVTAARRDRPEPAAILSLVTVILYFGILYGTGHMTLSYDTAMSRSIVNGDLIGYPNAHLLFTNYVLGLILTFLYRLLPSVNWYTLMLLFTVGLAQWAIIYRMLSLPKKEDWLGQIACGALAVFLFHAVFFESLMSLYFLNCAVIAGVGAFFYVITAEKLRRRDMFLISVLVILCAGIRFSIFKELVPFFLMAVFIRYCVYGKKEKIIVWIAALALIIVLMTVIDGKAYTSAFAREREVNHYRASIQDYDRWPEYEANEKYFVEIGIDRDEYDVLRTCWGLSDHLDRETLIKVRELFEAENASAYSHSDKIKMHLSKLIRDDYSRTFWGMETLFFLAGMLLVVKKRDWRMLFCYVGMLAITAAGLLYLAYQGRTPVRVTILPLLAPMLTGAGYLVHYRSEWEELMKNSRFLRLVVVPLAFLCLFGTCLNAEANYHAFENAFTTTAAELSLVRQFESDPEHTYFCHGLHDYLDLYEPGRRNYTGWGGWISETEDWKTMLRGDYENVWDALAFREDLRFVVPESSIETLVNYLNGHGYRCEATSNMLYVDGNGTGYRIWQLNCYDVNEAGNQNDE